MAKAKEETFNGVRMYALANGMIVPSNILGPIMPTLIYSEQPTLREPQVPGGDFIVAYERNLRIIHSFAPTNVEGEANAQPVIVRETSIALETLQTEYEVSSVKSDLPPKVAKKLAIKLNKMKAFMITKASTPTPSVQQPGTDIGGASSDARVLEQASEAYRERLDYCTAKVRHRKIEQEINSLADIYPLLVRNQTQQETYNDELVKVEQGLAANAQNCIIAVY